MTYEALSRYTLPFFTLYSTISYEKTNRLLHTSLLKIWDFFHECEKRRRISHTSGRNPRSSIETSVRTYFFGF